MLESANIFVTGGAGTLGRTIAAMRKAKGWRGNFTVYSTDEHKHAIMRALYPDIHFVQGDVRNPETLYNAMVGHDVVIHAAAVKVIPASEMWSIDTADVNVTGSLTVCATAVRAGVQHVLGISTDKACHPANAYGATKLLMEKIFQEYARSGFSTQFHLVRYGNVLESTGSVIEAWGKSVKAGKPIQMTDDRMTRFWLSPMQAVRCLIRALDQPTSLIYIPKLPALSIGKLAEYSLLYTGSNTISGYPIEKIPLRPGEKMHETLLTIEESFHAMNNEDHFLLTPSTFPRMDGDADETGYCFTSENAVQLSQIELLDLLKNE